MCCYKCLLINIISVYERSKSIFFLQSLVSFINCFFCCVLIYCFSCVLIYFFFCVLICCFSCFLIYFFCCGANCCICSIFNYFLSDSSSPYESKLSLLSVSSMKVCDIYCCCWMNILWHELVHWYK